MEADIGREFNFNRMGIRIHILILGEGKSILLKRKIYFDVLTEQIITVMRFLKMFF